MKIITVEAFEGDGYELVLCTTDEKQVQLISPHDYDTNILVVKEWVNGEVVNIYRKEISDLF